MAETKQISATVDLDTITAIQSIAEKDKRMTPEKISEMYADLKNINNQIIDIKGRKKGSRTQTPENPMEQAPSKAPEIAKIEEDIPQPEIVRPKKWTPERITQLSGILRKIKDLEVELAKDTEKLLALESLKNKNN